MLSEPKAKYFAATWPHRSFARAGWPVLAIVILAGFTGCGNGLATVSGQITVEGEPLSAGAGVTGRVFLYPEGGTGVPAVGKLDSEGRYSVRTGSQAGVKPGAYLVTVSASQLIPSKIDGAPPGSKRITARRYTDPSQSGIRVQVSSGSNDFDFDLERERRRQARRR